MRKALIATLSTIALVFGFAAAAGAQDDEPGTIVDVASGNDDFSTLVTAVQAAGLVETLSGPGPFTVFAPTDEAFDKLPDGTLETLLEDPGGDLTAILQLHVMSGAVDSEAAIAAAGGTVDTLGGPVSVELRGDDLFVGGAQVVSTDIEASNGVIHVIDTVITEPAAADGDAGEAAPAPTRVEAGDAGLAATASGANALLLVLLAGVAVLGLGASATALVRARRDV